MLRMLILLVCLLGSPLSLWAATFYADPAGGAAASCLDAGANVCTLTRAIVVAATGDTIIAACGTYDQAATTLSVAENFASIAPVSAGCATITGTHATAIVTLTASNDVNVMTFGAFKVQNTGGATSSTVAIANVAYDATVVMDGTAIIVGGTNRHIVDQATRGTLKLKNVTMTGTAGAQAGFYSVTTPSAAKKVSVDGGSCVLTASVSNTPCYYVERSAGATLSEWVEVKRTTVSLTVPGGLGATAFGVGIRLNRITSGTDLTGVTSPPVVELNTVSVTATAATSNDSYAILVGSTDATAIGDNVIVRNNVVTCNAPAARCLSVGSDGITANNASNVLFAGNTVTSPFYNGSATPHAISCGRVTNCTMVGNRITGFAVGALCSIGTNCLVTGNLLSGAYYAPLFAKGNTSASFVGNVVIMDDALYGAVFGGYGCLASANQSGTNNAATTFQNNLCFVRGGTSWQYVGVDTSQVASFERNNYYTLLSLATPWEYQGSNDATLSAWNTRATVGTDVSEVPWILTDPLP